MFQILGLNFVKIIISFILFKLELKFLNNQGDSFKKKNSNSNKKNKSKNKSQNESSISTPNSNFDPENAKIINEENKI